MVSGFLERNYSVGGFQAYITSDVLIGAGLSSSAAFETLIGTILSGLYNCGTVSVRKGTCLNIFHEIGVATKDHTLPVQTLSGGNQQKVVLARWLARRILKILILNVPNGWCGYCSAKYDIHKLSDKTGPWRYWLYQMMWQRDYSVM